MKITEEDETSAAAMTCVYMMHVKVKITAGETHHCSNDAIQSLTGASLVSQNCVAHVEYVLVHSHVHGLQLWKHSAEHSGEDAAVVRWCACGRRNWNCGCRHGDNRHHHLVKFVITFSILSCAQTCV